MPYFQYSVLNNSKLSPNILVNLWMPNTTIQARIQPLEILNPIRFDQVVGMTGVVHTNWLSWIKSENVKDYSFILTVKAFNLVFMQMRTVWTMHFTPDLKHSAHA